LAVVGPTVSHRQTEAIQHFPQLHQLVEDAQQILAQPLELLAVLAAAATMKMVILH
jgi:hypothetical protein